MLIEVVVIVLLGLQLAHQVGGQHEADVALFVLDSLVRIHAYIDGEFK